MVRVHVLAASFFALLSHALALASVSEATKASLVRRHSQSQEEHTFADMLLSGQIHTDSREEQRQQSQKKRGTNVNTCNHDWPLTSTTANADRNECKNGGVRIIDPEKCRLAASQLKQTGSGVPSPAPTLTYNGTYDWSWRVLTAGDTVYPEGCFVQNGVVHFNNEASTYTDQAMDASGVKTYEGVQICFRYKYQNGIADIDSRATGACDGTTFCGRDATGEGGACPGGSSDYVAIDGTSSTDYPSCQAAKDCIVGNDWCSLPAFEDNGTISIETRPRGCFRDVGTAQDISQNGCFSYNAASTVNTNHADWGGRTLCRLSTAYTDAQKILVNNQIGCLSGTGSTCETLSASASR